MQHRDTNRNVNKPKGDGERPHHPSVRPLTRRSAAGEILKRNPEVERQIREALLLSKDDLFERARLRNYMDPSYLQEECLVYLIREQRRAGDDRTVSTLAEVLLDRCAKHINERLQGGLSGEWVDEAFGDVIRKLFREIVDLTSDVGDFTQVMFWVRLERLITDAFRKQVRVVRRDQRHVSLQHATDTDAKAEMEMDSYAPAKTESGLGSSPEEELLRRELISEGLGQLDERVRTAFILRYREGWPIESNDPDEETISKYFKVTPRTVRNWFEQAEKNLIQWRRTL